MSHRVIVYSTPNCPYCAAAKDFLRGNNIPFEDIDVSQNREKAMEMVRKSGQMGVPVLDIDGDIIIGYNLPQMKRSLGIY